MSHASRNPLVPDRDGVSPSCVALPPGPWPRMLDFLSERLPILSAAQWAQRMHSGWVWNDEAQAIGVDAPFRAHTRLYYWRHQPGELPWPDAVRVVHQDAHLVVADKPHFMPVTPSGPFVQRSLLVHLKRELGLPELTPIHRIDRDTAGLVVFAVQARHRAAYQTLFRDRLVHKRYEAVAPWLDLDAALTGSGHATAGALGTGEWTPLAAPLALSHLCHNATQSTASRAWRYRSALQEDADFFTMHEGPGPANTETHIQCLARSPAAFGAPKGAQQPVRANDAPPCPEWALYALSPHTGRRHQLRAHLSALGMPIRHDPYYPRMARGAQDADDTDRPLQLLAKAIAFADPITGQARAFVSQQRLQWPVVTAPA